ncbi:MAG: hypothetical protein CMD35_05435 [Flavobacteriales bacterium]|nr:hypothetical protein [Flavobacteriales bacterium]
MFFKNFKKIILILLILSLGFVGIYFVDLFGVQEKINNQFKKVSFYNAVKEIPRIKIKMKKEEYNQLIHQRDTLLERGNIPWAIDGTEEKLKVKAKFKSGKAKSKGNIRIAGHFWDHWKRDPFSMKVRTKSPINGSSRFNLLNSRTRGHMTDWFAHKLELDAGLNALNSEYVWVDFNGEDKVYLFEGLYDHVFLKQKGFSNAVFVMEYTYDTTRQIKLKFPEKEPSTALVKRCSSLYDSLCSGSLSPMDFIDYKKMAKFYALGDLYQSTHQYYHFNLRYIFNGETNKIEPVGREYWIEDKGENRALFLTSHLNDSTREYGYIPEVLFKDTTFKKYYYKELEAVSQKSFLDKAIKKYQSDIERGKILLWRRYPWLKDPIDFKTLYTNQVWLRENLNN